MIFKRGRYHAQVTKYVTDAQVLRGGEYVSVDSRSLVPGDLLVVKDSWLLPCDLLILEGAASPVILDSSICSNPYITCCPKDLARSIHNLPRLLVTCCSWDTAALRPQSPSCATLCTSRPADVCSALPCHRLSENGTELLRCHYVSNASHSEGGLTMRTLSSMRHPAH